MANQRLLHPKRTAVRGLLVASALVATGLVTAAQSANAAPCIPNPTLTPTLQSRGVNGTATINVSVIDTCGAPDGNTVVTWGTLPGSVNNASGAVVTDSTGAATITYSGSVPGQDNVIAGVGIVGGQSLSSPATVNWLENVTMSAHAYGLSSSGLLKIAPTPEIGPLQTQFTSTQSKCVAAPRVGLLLTAQAVCADAETVNTTNSSVNAGASVANVGLKLGILPAISLRTVSVGSGSNCFGNSGTTEIGFLKIGTKTVIPKLLNVAPNTTLNVLGIKLILNQQIPVPGGLTVNAVHLIVPKLLDTVVASATSAISC